MKKSVTCLLIDDDDDDFEIFRLALSEIDAGIELTHASNGFDALERLNDQSEPIPDFVFIDLNMPRMNGRQCLQEIRKVDRLQTIPVFMYSTSADQKTIEESRRLGATNFLVKPSNYRALVNLLAELVVSNQ